MAEKMNFLISSACAFLILLVSGCSVSNPQTVRHDSNKHESYAFAPSSSLTDENLSVKAFVASQQHYSLLSDTGRIPVLHVVVLLQNKSDKVLRIALDNSNQQGSSRNISVPVGGEREVSLYFPASQKSSVPLSKPAILQIEDTLGEASAPPLWCRKVEAGKLLEC